MKLTQLSPRWWHDREGGQGQGLIFRCPHCEELIVVAFQNPIDGGVPIRGERTYWQREGDTFETLTLTPSIHYGSHWHGWIKNGEVTHT